MSAFSELGYREESPEEVDHVTGSMTTDAYRELLERRPSSVAHIHATRAGDEALERIKGILRERGRNGRGQSTTHGRQVTREAYGTALSPFAWLGRGSA